jgi:hypothetical protein
MAKKQDDGFSKLADYLINAPIEQRKMTPQTQSAEGINILQHLAGKLVDREKIASLARCEEFWKGIAEAGAQYARIAAIGAGKETRVKVSTLQIGDLFRYGSEIFTLVRHSVDEDNDNSIGKALLYKRGEKWQGFTAYGADDRSIQQDTLVYPVTIS